MKQGRAHTERHAALFNGWPRGARALAETVQSLLIHQHIAAAW
jgi:hypothetical protein